MKAHLITILSVLALLVSAVSAQNVTVTVVPIAYPIQISESGGSFDYLLFLTNNDSQTVTGSAWGIITPDDPAFSDPPLGPASITIPPGETIGYYRIQTIPAAVQTGTYTFNVSFGVYPSTVWDSSSVQFQKMGLMGIPDPFAPANLGASRFNLNPNYPNPFNPTTAISYELRAASQVSLRVYDTTGKLITTLVDSWLPAGTHGATFDGSNLASGIYLAMLQAGDYSAVQRMVLMK